jgi:hypothetical protein
VQDLGYMAFLSALGSQSGALGDAAALGAAFVILKRAKELFWVAVGYGVLLLAGGRSRPSPVAEVA